MLDEWAMIIYLVILQTIAIAAFLGTRSRQVFVLNDVIAAQVILLVGFYFVWGGYSVDAWKYLTGFDGSPLSYQKESLFWVIGNFLSKFVSDPWPLRIISVACVMLIIVSIFDFFGRKQRHSIIIALFVLALLPSFFFSFGNTIRQGLASVIIIYAMSRHQDGKSWWLFLATIAAWFVHQPSLILSLAIIAGMYASRIWIGAGLLLAPFAGFLIPEAASWVGVDVSPYVRYSGRSEGEFHWVKFMFAYPLAWWMLYVIRDKVDCRFYVLKAYACMVVFSSILVRFEVPFERLLAYSELFLPFIVPLVVSHLNIQGSRIKIIWALALLAGCLLWTHNSIQTTLGFA